jgi:hypothetical protein
MILFFLHFFVVRHSAFASLRAKTTPAKLRSSVAYVLGTRRFHLRFLGASRVSRDGDLTLNAGLPTR